MSRIRLLTLVVCLVGSGVLIPAIHAQAPLTETFVAADGSLTFDYPADWYARDLDGLVVIANEESAVSAIVDGGDIGTGQLVGAVYTTRVLLNEWGLDPAWTPREAVEAFFANADNPENFAAPIPLDFGGRAAALVEIASVDAEGLVIVLELGDGNLAMLIARALAGELEPFRPTVLALAATIRAPQVPLAPAPITPTVATRSAAPRDNAVLFEYPADWVAEELEDVVVVATSPAALEAALDDASQLADDAMWALVFSPGGANNVAGIRPNITLAEAAQTVIDEFALQDELRGEPLPLMFAGRPALRLNLQQENTDLLILVIDLGDGQTGLVIAAARQGDLAQFEPGIEVIANSVKLPSGGIEPLAASYRVRSADYELLLPSGWPVAELAGLVAMGNSPAALEAALSGSPLAQRQLGVLIYTPPLLNRLAPFLADVAELTAGDVLEAFIEVYERNMPRFEAVDTVALPDGGTAARSVFTDEAGQEGTALAVDLGGGAFAVVVGLADLGAYREFEPTVNAIAATLSRSAANPPVARLDMRVWGVASRP